MNKEAFNNKSTEEIIKLYSYCIDELFKRGILRTKNVTGELGEHYAKLYYKHNKNIDLDLEIPSTANIDAKCNNTTFAIKTVTTKTTSVFHGVTNDKNNKVFDKLIIVMLKDYIPYRIIETDWDVFFDKKKYHKTMGAYYININKDLENNSEVQDVTLENFFR